MSKMDDLEGQHAADRAAAAREGYVRWRMADVPATYTRLMPPSYDAATLWMAERTIREQMRLDQMHLKNPWRQVGPDCALLDLSNLSGTDLIKFGLGVSIPVGLTDAPKDGRWAECQPEIDRQRAASPEWAEVAERLRKADEREAAEVSDDPATFLSRGSPVAE